jgi:hypothetical protein
VLKFCFLSEEIVFLKMDKLGFLEEKKLRFEGEKFDVEIFCFLAPKKN